MVRYQANCTGKAHDSDIVGGSKVLAWKFFANQLDKLVAGFGLKNEYSIFAVFTNANGMLEAPLFRVIIHGKYYKTFTIEYEVAADNVYITHHSILEMSNENADIIESVGILISKSLFIKEWINKHAR
jgi:hypothetical protein